MKVRYSYLPQQFGNPDEILAEIKRQLLRDCDFTLGGAVARFEKSFAAIIGTKHAIGVGSGTDAIMLALKAVGVGHGDEVVTAANTFIATVGAINATGARAVLVDVTPYYTIDAAKIEKALTARTKAIVPVHLTGEPADMRPILDLAKRKGLPIVEDACQSIEAEIDGRRCGTMGIAGAFSLHPLKNLNVWGDAGMIVTSDDATAEKLRMLRNHGMKNRDEIEIFGYNSRLDTLQAIVGNWLIGQTHDITEKRIANAAKYDAAFRELSPGLVIPPRRANARRVYHLYMLTTNRRDELYRFLHENGVDAKIHYPIPLHLQKGLAPLGYGRGAFPVSEAQAGTVLTLPCDQHLSDAETTYVIETVRRFFKR